MSNIETIIQRENKRKINKEKAEEKTDNKGSKKRVEIWEMSKIATLSIYGP